MDYEKDHGGKTTSTGIRNFFDWVTEYLWDIIPQVKSSGTGIPRKKRASQGAYNFMEKDLKLSKKP